MVVDDEPAICELVQSYLCSEGFQVSTAKDGEAMRRVMDSGPVDLVILDLVLPGDDGFSLTRYLREHSDVGIIILTGKGETVDRVVGLEMGADDYLPKPFELRELLARVRSVLRRVGTSRNHANAANVARFAGWRLDFSSRRLYSPDNVDTPLTAGEFDLLAVFVTHPNRILSRDELLDLTRGRAAGPFDRTIDVQVGRLRQKIEPDAQHPTLIKTIRTAGYLFTPPVKS